MRAPASGPPYAMPQPLSASLPHSPHAQSGSRPAPPPAQPQQPAAPRDARDLLAMLGGIAAAPLSPRAEGSQPNGAAVSAARKSSPVDLASQPHTTVHPEGFSMDVRPGPIAPVPIMTPPLDDDAPLSPPPQRTDSSSDRGGSGSQLKSRPTLPPAPTPLFAPPVLSHDIFANLPLPGGGGGGGGGKGSEMEPVPEPSAARGGAAADSGETGNPPSAAEEMPDQLAAAPRASATRPNDGPLPPVSAKSPTTGPRGPGISSSSLLIDKAELVSRVDGLLTGEQVGLANGASAGPISKEDFVARALEVMQVCLPGENLGRGRSLFPPLVRRRRIGRS